MNRYAYPRTFHLPWSPGATSDDKRMSSTSAFVGQQVVVTEKRDGENTTLYGDGYVHARSVDGTGKEYQSWITRKWSEVAYMIDDDIRVCGENLYARHSIVYDKLTSYFEVFGMYQGEKCLAWNEVELYSALLDLHVVPVLYCGIWDEKAIQLLAQRVVADGGEGIVVRVADEFDVGEFSLKVGKYVRENHVQTDIHWTKNWVPNTLA